MQLLPLLNLSLGFLNTGESMIHLEALIYKLVACTDANGVAVFL